jgi:Uma2 family endonuclease
MTVLRNVHAADWISDGKPHPGRRMTEREFVEWVDDETRAEWVDGEVIVMPPVSIDHDNVAFWARSILQDFVEHFELGQILGPEVMVRLPRQRRRRTPDVLFVSKAREAILRPNHVEGAPDLIVEVVSPESVVRDWREKYTEYARAGVREYWVIDRCHNRVECYALVRGGKYEAIAEVDGKLASKVLPGFYLRTRWLLRRVLPSRRSVLRELGVKN